MFLYIICSFLCPETMFQMLLILLLMQVAVLFHNHHDLLEEFTHFLPDTSAPPGAHVSSSRAVMRGREDMSSMMPSMRHPYVDRVFIQISILRLFFCLFNVKHLSLTAQPFISRYPFH